MVILYIRHAKDRTSSHKHDEKLTEEGKQEAYNVALNLLEKYGIPDIIYYSPYHRAKKTLKYMMKAISKYRKMNNTNSSNKKAEIIIDPRLGRFFTKKERRNPELRDNTIKRGAIIHETWEDFETRIENQVNEISNSDTNIWNITHTLVLLKLSRYKNIDFHSHVEYLDVLEIPVLNF